MPANLTMRPATPADVPTLRRWETQEHVRESGAANDDWHWETELGRERPWREQWIAELDGRAIGYLEIIDPHHEPEQYWGAIGPGHRALDIWIGEADALGRGHGTQMMEWAIARCFANGEVHTILLDPLASNTRARRFYERLGFECAEERGFGEDRCCVYRLARDHWRLRTDAAKDA